MIESITKTKYLSMSEKEFFKAVGKKYFPLNNIKIISDEAGTYIYFNGFENEE